MNTPTVNNSYDGNLLKKHKTNIIPSKISR